MRAIVATAIVFWGCAVGSGMAGSIADCDSALIVSTYNKIESSKSDWRMASHVNQSTYEQLKIGAGGSAVIYGIPMGADYNEFKENIKNYTVDNNTSYSQEQFRNISWTGLSADAADAYKECIRSQKKGLLLIPDKATDTDISFRIGYSVVGGSQNPLPIEWAGGAGADASLPKKVSAGEKIIVLNRPSKTSTLALNSADNSGFSDSVTLTPLPDPIPSELKYSSKCKITKTPNPGPVAANSSYTWACDRLRAGTYQVSLNVNPSSARPLRLGWHATVTLKGEKGDQVFPLKKSSGSPIDSGVNAGIGTNFQSNGNIIDVTSSGSLPLIELFIESTYWHGDFSKPSNEPVTIPSNVSIEIERK